MFCGPDEAISAMKTSVPSSGTISRREALLRLAWGACGVFAAPVLGSGVAGCGSAAKAQTFTQAHRDLLAAIVDHIIPPTDTPGASAVGVPGFIEEVWAVCFSPEGKQRFLDGLAAIDERAQARHGASFLACTSAQQQALLAQVDSEAFRPSSGAALAPPPPDMTPPDSVAWVWGEPAVASAPPPFWQTLKRLTLLGYYTSEPGATQELRYEAVPGRYEGCIPFGEVGRTWA